MIKPIIDFPGYFVSDKGEVFSAWYRFKGLECRIGSVLHELKLGSRNGYYKVALCKDSKRFDMKVHHLVLEAFVGKRPLGLYGLHRDDNRMNNSIDNLYWGTPKDNDDDSILNGRYKFLPQQIIGIRILHFMGVSLQELALNFSSCCQNISDICLYKSYSIVK